ncbi:MAG TPA: hypothetical protein VMW35_16860 [Myxococcota bacterium]|jgi:hypothetical protein|nr:hypothetical protein [Myxococcota bacterium]
MHEGRDGAPTTATGTAPEGMRCDFCGEVSTSVRRVALDRGYERLQTPHREQYACPACSAKKERRRLGLERG